MLHSMRATLCLALVCVLASTVAAQKKVDPEIVVPKSYKAPVIEASADLQRVLSAAVDSTVAANAGVKTEDVAATLIDIRDPAKFKMAEVRGSARIYPASVVKMFFLAALERQIEDGKVTVTPELTRGARDMIVDSSNEATQYILDVLTNTASGAEMPQKQFEEWQYKRDRANRWFSSMGYANINVNQKTFCEDAYGIEQQSRGYKGQNRNMLNTNATARLLAEIVLGRIANAERTAEIMKYLGRDPFAETKDPNDQAHGFIGKALFDKQMRAAKLWSKAGWTSKTRHDAAYIETPDGQKFVLVIFTENHANKRDIIPTIAGKVIGELSKK